jgi:hypothetical protein
MSEMKTYDGYAVYSETQFNHISRNTKCPYIYYKNEKDEVVQVTEVLINKEDKSTFSDAVYLGKVKWYGAFQDYQNIIINKSEEP